MSPATWTPNSLLAGLLAAAALIALARLCLRQWRGSAATRLPGWRVMALLALQPLLAGLLLLTLSPPPKAVPGGTLTVLTEGADPALLEPGDAGPVVALPEAGAVPAHVERVPDLGTALRRHRQARTLRVLGHGLVPRDHDALDGRTLHFEPTPLPAGLVELRMPQTLVAGGVLRVSGRAQGLDGGRALLLDPAGRQQDARVLEADGRFSLAGGLRLPGEAGFVLRLEDADGGVRDDVQLPVWVQEGRPLRVALHAGAPSPEVKYLRRWADDAGLRMQAQIATGAGMRFGDAMTPLDAARLGEIDLLVADERSWAGWSAGQRQAVLDAVAQGMGLLLRISAPPPSEVRAQWRALGFAVEPTGAPVGFALPAPATVDEAGQDASALPSLGRIGVRVDAGDAAVLARDADGAALGWWRSRGLGRIGLWLPADSFRLVLAGHADRHGLLWAGVFESLARAPLDAGPSMPLDADPRVGQRLRLCGLDQGMQVRDAADVSVALHVDPATGARRCAGYWPTTAGWHRLLDAEGRARVFFVRAQDDAPLLALAERQRATHALATGPGLVPEASAQVAVPGSPWPWALAWLLALAASWWLERRRAPGGTRT